MNFAELTQALASPDAYRHAPQSVQVLQTHISVVFLAGEYVYKIRKPVRFPFLDFSTLELRHADCEREVALNQRLAPQVYLGTVPIARDDRRFSVEGDGEVVEWAVKMLRLPDHATLEQHLGRDEFDAGLIDLIGRRLADFHGTAEADARFAEYARFDTISRNALDNLQGEQGLFQGVFSERQLSQLVAQTQQHLAQHRELIEWRAEHGKPRDTHGDLRLDHVYLFPERVPPDDLVVIDCIEFNDGFRFADPVSDIAFLIMDLKFHGRHDLARRLADRYFEVSEDDDGRRLLPLYTSYRAAVRAKVNMLKAREPDVPEAERLRAREHAEGHLHLALGELLEPAMRPCLVIVSGLPGTGKSTLSRELAACANFTVIRTDVVRKELAGIAEAERTPAARGTELYSADWTARTYAECLRRAVEAIQAGQRVIADGTFSRDAHRQEYLAAARRLGVPCLIFVCQADPQLVRDRLAVRTGDASDADWQVYQAMVEKWEPATGTTLRVTRVIETSSVTDARGAASKHLTAEGLLKSPGD